MTARRTFGLSKALVGGVMLSAALVGCQKYTDPVADAGAAAAIRKALVAGGAGEGGGSETVAEPTGFVDFKGVFKLDGPAPTMAPLRVTSDQAVCAPGGKTPLAETVVVGPNSGLANVVIFLNTKVPEGDPKWEHVSYAADKDALLTGRESGFDQENCIFLKHVFAMRASQTLEILNSDPVGHNTNIAGGNGAAGSNAIVGAGQKTTYSPGGESRGPFSVSCNIHPWMKAYMIVRKSPYVAVTGPDGTFSMPKAPAGVELEFRVWHEKLTFVPQATVSIDGGAAEARKWSKGRFKITLPADQPELNMQVSLDSALFQ